MDCRTVAAVLVLTGGGHNDVKIKSNFLSSISSIALF